MKVITCVSYHGTGSGAVEDFFKEFDNIAFGPNEFECRFLQDPDGIRDLDYNITENYHRLNSGYAVKRYEKFIYNNKRLYSKIFGKDWIKISEEYIESLIKFKYKGYWHQDLNDLNPVSKFMYKVKRILNKIVPKKIRKPNYYNYFRKKETYHVLLSKDEFIAKTQNYVNNLCQNVANNYDYIWLDQCVPTNNLDKYVNYFQDIKVIVIDRDPRDSFIEHKKAKDHVLPNDVYKYCQTYKDYRVNAAKHDTKNVLRIQFEDLIYKYDETTKKMIEFVGIDNNRRVLKKCFFPNVSMKNTKLWDKNHEYDEEIKIIEEELNDYLYKY